MSVFDLAARAKEGGVALITEEQEITFAELHARAMTLRHETSGTPLVAFVAHPSTAALSFTCAMLASGVAILPVHPRCTEVELAGVLTSYPDAAFFSEGRIDHLLRDSRPGRALVSPPDDERLCAILLSSGTTGSPKGVLLSRRAFRASAMASAENLGWNPSDRWLLSMPFSHAGGLSIVTRCLAAGRPIVLHPRFDPERVLRSIEGQGVTLLSVVPTMLAALIEVDRKNSLRRLRAILVGGAPCPPDLVCASRDRGAPILLTYGLTEACSQVTTQRLDEHEPRTARDSGRPLSGIGVNVVDRCGRAVVGEEGRVLVSGPTLMTGYAGEGRLDPGASIDSGDLGSLDERGRLTISGRADDLIISGGENVSPTEVELSLRSLDGVTDALVLGLPDPRWGQIVGALLVLEPGHTIDGVLAALRGRVAGFKVPRLTREVTLVPVGITGKPDRRAARELLSS